MTKELASFSQSALLLLEFTSTEEESVVGMARVGVSQFYILQDMGMSLAVQTNGHITATKLRSLHTTAIQSP